MKKFIIILSIIFCLLSTAYAATYNITFGWDANSESDLGGYRLYYSKTSGNQTIGDPNTYVPIGANTVTHTIENFPGVSGYFVLTAFDTSGNESLPSNEVFFDPNAIGPQAPNNLEIIITIKVNI